MPPSCARSAAAPLSRKAERSFQYGSALSRDVCRLEAAGILKPFAALLKASGSSSLSSSMASAGWGAPPAVSAHLAPLFGAMCNLAGLTLEQTACVFMLSHVKALVSAAVRASMFGPYQAQKVLASEAVQRTHPGDDRERVVDSN